MAGVLLTFWERIFSVSVTRTLAFRHSSSSSELQQQRSTIHKPTAWRRVLESTELSTRPLHTQCHTAWKKNVHRGHPPLVRDNLQVLPVCATFCKQRKGESTTLANLIAGLKRSKGTITRGVQHYGLKVQKWNLGLDIEESAKRTNLHAGHIQQVCTNVCQFLWQQESIEQKQVVSRHQEDRWYKITSFYIFWEMVTRTTQSL